MTLTQSADHRLERSPLPGAPLPYSVAPQTDLLARPLRDLRISVTDRCNFRCLYCMPRELFGLDHEFMPRSEVLTPGEIARVAELFVANGVAKVRLTGGEPLVRRDLPTIVARLAAIPGVDDLTITTNGSLLARRALELREAGLRRVTVSLDSLDDNVFAAMNGVGYRVGDILRGIRRAREAGLAPIKINMIVKRGVNEASVLPLVRYCRGESLTLRLIEYMDVGESNGWQPSDVVPAAELLASIDAVYPIEPVASPYMGQVASRWRYLDGGGEIGIIGSISQPFCGGCTRARITADGRFYTCLFSERGTDLRALLRGGVSDSEIAEVIASTWRRRSDRYSEERASVGGFRPKVEMNTMGG